MIKVGPGRASAARKCSTSPWTPGLDPTTLHDMELGTARNSMAQLRRGVLEFCVLALLHEEELYGFDLVRRLGEANGMVTSEGTIYPLLSRLRRDGWVSTSWRESMSGPPRRYYAITPAGHLALAGFTSEWQQFRDSVDVLLRKGVRSGGSHG